MNKFLYFTYLVIITVSLFVCGCSSHRRTVKRGHHREVTITEQEIEKEAERNLKGDEKRVVEEAFEWIGTPYEYGRQDKGVATDCSGMVMLVYEKTLSCKLPRNSAKQAEFCDHIKENQVLPGDLVFFITNGGEKINHVGIMIDQLQFIHAGSHGVTVSSMESTYYKTHVQKYGRVPCMTH